MNNEPSDFIRQNQELWKVFKNPLYVWHSTKKEHFLSIKSNGIRPGSKQYSSNSDAPLPLGAFFKAVCLFDFCIFNDEKILKHFASWNVFLTYGEGSRYWFAINKASILDNYFTQKDQKFLDLENSEMPEKYGNRFQYIESWHAGSIPYDSIAFILKISKTDTKYNFERNYPNSL